MTFDSWAQAKPRLVDFFYILNITVLGDWQQIEFGVILFGLGFGFDAYRSSREKK